MSCSFVCGNYFFLVLSCGEVKVNFHIFKKWPNILVGLGLRRIISTFRDRNFLLCNIYYFFFIIRDICLNILTLTILRIFILFGN